MASQVILDKDYYRDGSSDKLVDPKSSDDARLVGRAGSAISGDEAERFGIKGRELNERDALLESEELNRATVTPTNMEAKTLVAGDKEIEKRTQAARDEIVKRADQQREASAKSAAKADK